MSERHRVQKKLAAQFARQSYSPSFYLHLTIYHYQKNSLIRGPEMEKSEVQHQLENLIRKVRRIGEHDVLPKPLLLFGEGGALDSVATLRLIMAIESAFNIAIEDEELTAEHFRTFEALVDFVQSKLTLPEGS